MAIVLIRLFVVGLSIGGGALNVGQWLTSLVTGTSVPKPQVTGYVKRHPTATPGGENGNQ